MQGWHRHKEGVSWKGSQEAGQAQVRGQRGQEQAGQPQGRSRQGRQGPPGVHAVPPLNHNPSPPVARPPAPPCTPLSPP